MNIEQKDTYFVAVKIFLEHGGKLFVFKDRFGDWDLPGGRIKRDEFSTPLDQVIRRKILEELGNEVECSVGKPEVFMRHERHEAVPGSPIVRIFAIGYPAILIKGSIRMSKQHIEMKWVDPLKFKPEEQVV